MGLKPIPPCSRRTKYPRSWSRLCHPLKASRGRRCAATSDRRGNSRLMALRRRGKAMHCAAHVQHTYVRTYVRHTYRDTTGRTTCPDMKSSSKRRHMAPNSHPESIMRDGTSDTWPPLSLSLFGKSVTLVAPLPTNYAFSHKNGTDDSDLFRSRDTSWEDRSLKFRSEISSVERRIGSILAIASGRVCKFYSYSRILATPSRDRRENFRENEIARK